MIIDMRLPVTSSRRCEQMTAFGASEVPDVKISAQMESTSGSSPGSRRSGERCERVRERHADLGRGIVAVGEAGRGEHRRQAIGDRLEEGGVPGFGQHEPAMRVLDIAQQVGVAPGVVEPDHRCADEGGAAEREEVVGRVVEQHGHVARTGGRQALREQRREPARLREVLGVGPFPARELDRDPVAVLLGVAPEQGRGIGRDEGRLTGGGADRGAETDIGVRDYA